MPQPKAYDAIPTSGQFDFMYGIYRLSNWSIPYLVTTMTLRQAAESLRLVNDFPGAESLAWKLDELYQRDLDWTRVERKILPYLRSATHPQFFNSLTVALMPILANKVKASFAGDDWIAPELDKAENFAKIIKCGPIRLGYYQAWESITESKAKLGQMRWNSSQVFSVAIDGQHRLAAIKRLVTGYDEAVDRTCVPVIIIVLEEMLGYRSDQGKGLVDVLRTLFIDLNKHAEPVSRTRQLLLDDKDPHSLCVRALVGQQIQDGDDELKQATPVLPLALVDWHSDQAKFDEGPYLATILGLDWIATAVFGSKPIKDYTDYVAIRKQLKAISTELGLGMHTPQSETYQRLKELAKFAVQPFQYNGEQETGAGGELRAIVTAFRQVWVPPLIEILSGFRPYGLLVGKREATQSLTIEFINWYYLKERAKRDKSGSGKATEEYRNLVDRLRNRVPNPVSEADLEERLTEVETLKGDSLAFKVVFQRALIHAFLEFIKIEAADVNEFEAGGDDEEGEDVDGDDEELPEDDAAPVGAVSQTSERARLIKARAAEFLSALNRLVDRQPTFLAELCACDREGQSRLWLGSLLDPLETIDFTLGASKRAKELIFWPVVLDLLRVRKDELVSSGFDSFWEGLWESDLAIHKRLRRSIERFARENGVAGRILGDRWSDAAGKEEAKLRVAWMWKQLKLPEPEIAGKQRARKK